MAATTIHTRKRQFQPSLDSYFTRSSSTSSTSPTTTPLSPPLPAETQASLLSVGMRARKSVPEGYKTHKTLPAPTTRTIHPHPHPSSAPPPTLRSSSSTSSTRELMPFCGLHKTGGWAMQETPASSAPAVLGGWEDEDAPGLSFSQRTMELELELEQSGRGLGESRKRGYEDEAEEEMDAFFEEMEDETETPVHRSIARLRRRGAGKGVGMVQGRGLVVDDFAEAAFLSPMDVDS